MCYNYTTAEVSVKRYILAFVALATLVAVAWGCSGSRGTWGDRFHDEMLNYEEQDVVNFNISGTTTCARCETDNLSVAGVMIEVTPKNDPTKMLGAKMFDGVGPFTIPNIRWQSGTTLHLTAMIFADVDNVLYTEEQDVVVPDGDGKTVAVSVNFGSN